ncbi:hypothetical protein, conserved [Leishmania tarentolae]|uniref:Uncharacterized protein n=1 Tax=Leishmania tarentolae TaxID=5689 RepID=A0A640KXB4_LEITA|nr:hypothetical protein, conserved [Leishmania tarentolae]
MSLPHTESAVSETQGVQGSAPTNAGKSKLGTLSVSELRTAMQQHLRSTGALRKLKTQLRGMVLTELLQQPKTARMLVHGASQSVPPSRGEGQLKLDDSMVSATGSPGKPAIAVVSGREDHTLQTWSCGLADALVENHLRRTRRAMSLSIFSTEAEVPPFSASGAPSEEEQYLAHLFRQIDAGAPANPEDDILAPSPSRSMKSVLQRLVEDHVTRQGPTSTAEAARHLHSCSTQTEAADSVDSATNALNSLECRLAAVDAKYALTFSQLKRSSSSAEQPFFLRSEVERRLQQHKNDMHAQLRSEYEQKYNSFTRVKLQEVRDEAEGRYRLLVQNKTEELAEMERSLLVKLEQERQRLKMAWEDVHQQRAELERRQRDTMKQLADCEAAKQQCDAELHSWKEKTRGLQLQCAKWEELCGTRLMELDGARSREERRVEDIRRLQAEHAAELQLKEEEIGRLRYRLRLLLRERDHSLSAEAAEGALTGRNEKMGNSAVPITQQHASTAPIDPQQLYGLLLRTEELQRNAVVQQQQQQKRLDAAWVAAAAAAVSPAPATAVTTTPEPVHAERFSSPPTPAVQTELRPPKSSEGRQVNQPSSHSSESSGNRVGAASAPVTAILAVSVSAATPATLSPPSPKGSSPEATAPATVAKSPPAEDDKPQESSASSKKSLSTRASVALPSSSVSSTQPTPQKPASVPTAGAPATESFTPSSTHTATSSSSTRPSASARLVEPRVDNADDGSGSRSAAAALLNAMAEEEQSARDEVQSEESKARDGIAWLEGNRRELLADDSKRSRGDSGEVSPWNHLGGVTSAPQFGSGAAVNFSDSFSSDDAALIRDSDEDDVEF